MSNPEHSTKTDELVSVVISLFNKQEYIERTIFSLLQQSHFNLEIIVVDDCSSDNSRKVVQNCAQSDPRVVLVEMRINGGTAAARNLGMKKAKGGLLFLVDADDLVSPYAVEELVVAMRSSTSDVGMCFGHMVVIDSNDVILPTPDLNHGGDEKINRTETWIMRNVVGCGSGVLLKKNLLPRAGYFDESLRQLGAEGCDDWMFFLSLQRYCKSKLVPITAVGYREVPDAQSLIVSRMWSSYLYMIERARDWYPEIENRCFKSSRAQLSVGFAESAWVQGQHSLSIQLWINGLLCSPKYLAKKVLWSTKRFSKRFNNATIEKLEPIEFYSHCALHKYIVT